MPEGTGKDPMEERQKKKKKDKKDNIKYGPTLQSVNLSRKPLHQRFATVRRYFQNRCSPCCFLWSVPLKCGYDDFPGTGA